jgi:hypothetical protein
MRVSAENSGKQWSPEEDQRLRELAALSEIAAKLHRTEAATKARAYVLRVGLGRVDSYRIHKTVAARVTTAR